MVQPIACPCCLHEDTMRARTQRREPCHDDQALMLWNRPSRGGIRAQVCTQWDQGWWECVICDLRLPPHKAGVLLDAALMHAFPDCDSISSEGIHADTLRALHGGNKSTSEGD
jgi:hypothetical protein